MGGRKNKGKERDWECDKNLDILIKKGKCHNGQEKSVVELFMKVGKRDKGGERES